MNEKIMILMVSAAPYDFTDEKGVRHEGTSYKVYLAHFHEGAEMPHFVEICKASAKDATEAFKRVGKVYCGAVLYDRYGRFCGISDHGNGMG